MLAPCSSDRPRERCAFGLLTFVLGVLGFRFLVHSAPRHQIQVQVLAFPLALFLCLSRSRSPWADRSSDCFHLMLGAWSCSPLEHLRSKRWVPIIVILIRSLTTLSTMQPHIHTHTHISSLFSSLSLFTSLLHIRRSTRSRASRRIADFHEKITSFLNHRSLPARDHSVACCRTGRSASCRSIVRARSDP